MSEYGKPGGIVTTAQDREMERALEADGEKLRQMTGENHGPFHIMQIRARAYKIAAAIGEQIGADMLDNLGDGESLVFMGKLPALNIVQLAETMQEEVDTLKRGHALEVEYLKTKIEALEIELASRCPPGCDGG